MFTASRLLVGLHSVLAVRHPELLPELFGRNQGTAPTVADNPAGAPFMALRDLRKRFGKLNALDGIGVDLRQGEVLGVCGPNGAGKSTLLAAATGHLRPDSGEVTLGGQRLTGAPPHRFCAAGVARMFQKPDIFPTLTVGQNVATGAMFGPRSQLPGAHGVDEILARTGLATLSNSPAAGVDLLTRKRIMLAAALATNPVVLFLDEPLAGLNAAEIDTFVALLAEVRDAFGLTVVMVEHKVRALAGISDRILVMNFGRLLKLGPPQEVLADPEVVSIYLGKRHVA